LKQISTNTFSSQIITWYHQKKRLLPWRMTKEPYLIWLSEIILQQTKVAQGLPYYNRFVKQYPRVNDLAKVTEEEVLRVWQGLGYYSRARNLHKCARIIVNDYDGEFPDTMKGLLSLPGIGNYTAAAIASLAFNEPVPVVDGNVYRVLARYFGVDLDIASSKAYKYFYELSTAIINKETPGDYNQAVMEFGALQCKPSKPDCTNCILNQNCIAFAKGKQEKWPVKKKKPKAINRYFFYLLIKDGDKILMRQRLEKDIWQGLYEFVLIETDKPVIFDLLAHPALLVLQKNKGLIEIDDKIIRHVLSHQVLNVNFAVVNLKKDLESSYLLSTDGYNWYELQEVEALPKPVLISKYLDTYLNSINLQ